MSAPGSAAPPPSPTRVPTLTEIVELAEPAADVPIADWPLARVALPTEPAPGPAPDIELATVLPPALPIDEAHLAGLVTERVVADLQQRVDLVFEVRLREALAPALARAAEQLIGEARTALAAEMRELVARAVAQELSRRRSPRG